MASETKVGLLAGLAFIICFAVILANRGQTRRNIAETLGPDRIADRLALGNESIQPAPQNAARTQERQPGGGRPQPFHSSGNSQAHPNTRRVQTPVRDDGPVASGAEIDWAVDEDQTERRIQADRHVTDERQVADAAGGAGRLNADPSLTAINPRQDNNAALEALLQSKGAQRTPDSVLSSDRERSTAPAQPAPTRTPSRTYEVKPGDTLTAIARSVFGSADGHHLDALQDANRSNLTDPDRLLVGMKLVIPDMANPTRQSPAKQIDKQEARLVTDRASGRSNFRWYQVKPSDRYARIAREQLGDAGRWDEIYELNKDKFPDPDRIREGVRIKLPLR